MELLAAVKWAVLYRLVAAGALIAGVVLVIAGFVLGFGGALGLLLEDPLNPQHAIGAANPLITIALVAVGFVVWQIGKTLALFLTLPRAAGRAAARRFDTRGLKSDILDGLDGRLAEIEADVAETKRSVQELKREHHAANFDEETALSGETSDETTGGVPATREVDPAQATDSTESDDELASFAYDEDEDGDETAAETDEAAEETDDAWEESDTFR